MEEQEKYLDGITSKWLARGLIRGYAIYATTKRLIGVSKRKQVLEAGFLPGVIKVSRDAKKEKSELEGDQSMQVIKDLLKSKDFEAKKSDIKLISLKKPGAFKQGRVKILLNSGEEIEIKLGSRAVFERVGEIMQSFSPDLVQVEN
jgi:hypothetical protein